MARGGATTERQPDWEVVGKRTLEPRLGGNRKVEGVVGDVDGRGEERMGEGIGRDEEPVEPGSVGERGQNVLGTVKVSMFVVRGVVQGKVGFEGITRHHVTKDCIKDPRRRGDGRPRPQAPSSFASSLSCIPRLLTYNVNSLSFYASSQDARLRRDLQGQAWSDFIKDNDILLFQETNLCAEEAHALSTLGGLGCVVSRNGFEQGVAGTAIVDSPQIRKYFVGHDVDLPECTRGRIQLRKYYPKDPVRSPFQVFNFYLVSGPEYTASSELIQSLLSVDNFCPHIRWG